jgi:hypothetical protein
LRPGSKALNIAKYEEAEKFAKSKKLGLWDESKKDLISFEALKPQEVAEKFVGKRFTNSIVIRFLDLVD